MRKFDHHAFRRQREELSLSQRAYGLLFGFTRPQKRVSEIERGERAVSNQVRTIARYIREVHACGRLGAILDYAEKQAPREATNRYLAKQRKGARNRERAAA